MPLTVEPLSAEQSIVCSGHWYASTSVAQAYMAAREPSLECQGGLSWLALLGVCD